MSIRFISLFAILFCLSAAESAYSQAGDTLSVDYTEQTLEYILEDLAEQYNIQLAYSTSRLNTHQKITLSLQQVSILRLLEELGQQANFEAKLTAGKYVLTPKKQKRITLSGYIKEESTGESLVGATIIRSDSSAGTVANEFGYFSLPVYSGYSEVIVSFVGMEKLVLPIQTNRDTTVTFRLQPAESFLEEIRVSPTDSLLEVSLIRENAYLISNRQLLQRVTAFGEQDVIKSLDQIAGVQLFRDGSSFFNVRGGNRDQNQILVDDAPIYNPAHFFGLYSSIIPEAVKSIKVYKGDFPVRFGGRISSVMDIRTRDGDMNTHHLEGSLGLISAKVLMEGPLKKDKSSYLVSARRSYLGELLSAQDDAFDQLYFRDLNLKLNHIHDENNRFYLSIFNAFDNFRFDDFNGISWGNTGASLRWNHVLNDRTFANFTLYGSRYDYTLSGNPSLSWKNHIANLSAKADLSFYVNESNTIKYGLRISGHNFNPGNLEDSTGNIPAGYDFVPKKNTVETSLYVGHEWEISNRLSLDYGLRVSNWANHGRTIEYLYENNRVVDTLLFENREKYHEQGTLEPRIALTYQAGISSFLQLNYTRAAQYLNLISNSISPFNNLEIWFPASINLQPQRSHQMSFGWTKWGKNWQFSTDLYGKLMENQLDYRDQAQLLLNATIENQLVSGTGLAYGLETTLSKKTGRLTGDITYAYSRSLLQIDGINNSEVYPALWDRPHQLSLQVSYGMRERVSLSASFFASSGAAISVPTSYYEYQGRTLPFYSQRNNARLPSYYRFDGSATFRLNKNSENRYQHYLQLSVFNMLNNKNAVLFNFNKIEDGDGGFVVPRDVLQESDLKATQLYVYSFIPSITYSFRL